MAPGDTAMRASMVTPLVRALDIFLAFNGQDRWLGNSQLADRTRLPASTVSRIAQTLAHLGYLCYDSQARKYRLAPAVLGLGYAAIAHSEVQQVARASMQDFAQQHKVHVCLAARDRLDLVVLESHSDAQAQAVRLPQVGLRVGIAHSPLGWSLLAALPELERFYLFENVEHRMPREWVSLRRRASEGIAQVQEKGYCAAIGEWAPELGIVAAPLVLEGQSPYVLACIGPSARMTRARVERELGPRLLAMTRAIGQDIQQVAL